MNAIFNRRSVRQFNEKEVENEKIELLLKAAMQAPSSRNQQPWEFYVIKGKENLEKLSKYNPYANAITTANLAILLVSNTQKLTKPESAVIDVAAATQNILLEATSLGLGSLWCGMWPNKERMTYVSELYQLPDYLEPISVVAIGYPSKSNANYYEDRYNENKITYINE
ncbi:nitroreductase family protein [Tannockella kyphosi]|uniref:nitroreductase family protein n=1 Tax=Tannockella kyphosi TaxID=2899121 RepID=UPI0020127DC7|nr:nitroreductase family protein [Tannockella kyphosi]